ncbi:MAG TPA: HNH endonuclease signature motif containing protein [Pirellulaceae bacterium]|jgi:5-methylcytosine-specific restriction endonuclease McrA
MDAALRKAVWERANSKCEYCQIRHSSERLPFELEHVVARKHGGATQSDNLALACFACNRYKGPNLAGIDPETGNMVALFHPRRDAWEDHFFWEAAILRGRSPIGRATIAVLRINDTARISHRSVLLASGDFSG